MSLVLKPWDAFVITKLPVAGSYVAPVGVILLPPVTITAPVVALTNTCVLDTTSAVILAPDPFPDRSVIATETGLR